MLTTAATWGMLAYVGPGAGLGLLGALIGLFLAVGSALGFVILWPLRKMFRKRRANTDCATDVAEQVRP